MHSTRTCGPIFRFVASTTPKSTIYGELLMVTLPTNANKVRVKRAWRSGFRKGKWSRLSLPSYVFSDALFSCGLASVAVKSRRKTNKIRASRTYGSPRKERSIERKSPYNIALDTKVSSCSILVIQGSYLISLVCLISTCLRNRPSSSVSSFPFALSSLVV